MTTRLDIEKRWDELALLFVILTLICAFLLYKTISAFAQLVQTSNWEGGALSLQSAGDHHWNWLLGVLVLVTVVGTTLMLATAMLLRRRSTYARFCFAAMIGSTMLGEMIEYFLSFHVSTLEGSTSTTRFVLQMLFAVALVAWLTCSKGARAFWPNSSHRQLHNDDG